MARPSLSPFSGSPNARSKTITTTDDADTYGILNCHSTRNMAYQVGVSEDKGTRRTMEDSHSFVVDFAGVRGQGFFAVFDGHAGKHAAEWCGNHFHEYLLECLHAAPDVPIPDVLNETFHNVDGLLSRITEDSGGKVHSGCTAVTAFLRVEDAQGTQSFVNGFENLSIAEVRHDSPVADATAVSSVAESGSDSHDLDSGEDKAEKKTKKRGSKIKNVLKTFSTTKEETAEDTPASLPQVIVPPMYSRRVLYTANAGDARAVLCRGGKAVRLTYDHKGSDKQEAKRITDAGGFVMSGRVNGVLAVTRSLGDSSMKEFVVGAPYTTETELCEEDEVLILACDGLWDVIADQAAIDLIREIDNAQTASHKLLNHALSHHTTDNVTVLVVRLKNVIPHTA